MNCKLREKYIWVFFCYYLVFQSAFLIPVFAQDPKIFDASFYSPNDGDVITDNYIKVTGVVGPISEEELQEGGICVSYELYDEERSYYQADDCTSLSGTTEYVNSVLREGYLIPPPPHPGEHHFIISAKTVDTYSYIKEMTIYFEPCGNDCIRKEQNLGPDEKCD